LSFEQQIAMICFIAKEKGIDTGIIDGQKMDDY